MRFIVSIFLTVLIQWLLRGDFAGDIKIVFGAAIVLAFSMDFVELLNMLHKKGE